MPNFFLKFALGTMLPLVTSAFAQQVPDAGRLMEDVRPAPSLPQRVAPKVEIEERPATAVSEGIRIQVTHLRITGATLFSEAELHALIADGEGQERSLGELQDLAARLSLHYRQRGYLLARAYLPAQGVQQGEVEIAILEGRLGQLAIHNVAEVGGASLAPLSQLNPGAVAHDRTLERSLLLLSDLPGVEVRSTLKPGATMGATDLLVEVAPGRSITGSVDMDTYGDRFSGQNRLGATFNLNNPLRLGDQASVRAVTSDGGMTYVRASYQLPVGASGTRVGVAGSDMHYALGKSLESLHAQGEAQTSSLYTLHPLVRSRVFNLNAQLQYSHQNLEDRIGSTNTVIHKSIDAWSAGFSGDFEDRLGGGGANNYSVTYTGGNLVLDPVTEALDAVTAHTAGEFGKVNFTWLRLQRLTDAASLYVSASGQLASKNLDSSEKMSIGGANGVRAYPQGEASGDKGYVLTVELRRTVALPWPGLWQLTAFIDSGYVTSNTNSWSSADDSRTLSAGGIGFNVVAGSEWTVKASLAWRLGPNTPVSDVDRTPRAWFQAVKFI